MWFERRLLRSLGGTRNLESVLPSQRSTEIPGRSSGAALLTVSPSFHLGRCESPLGNYSKHSHESLRATPLWLPAAPEIREGGAKRVGGRRRPVAAASLCEA